MVVTRHAAGIAVAAVMCAVGVVAPEAHEVPIHRALTDLAIDYLLTQRPELAACGTSTTRDALKDGVAREDDFTYAPAGNFLFHFTPALVDSVNDRLSVESRCSSVQWGFEAGRCTADMTFTPRTGRAVNVAADEINLHRYQLVLEDLRARPGPEKTAAIRSLGHFLHLLQDLTSPAHTLQDAHPHLPNTEFDDPSVFEVSNLSRPAFPLPLPTAPLMFFADAQQAFTQLQQFTSTNFTSEKRLRAGHTPVFNTVDANGYLRRNLRANGTFIPGGWRVARIAPVGNSQGIGRLVIDAPVAADQFEQLAQEAIRYTASMIAFIHDRPAVRTPVCEEAIDLTVVGNGSVTSSSDATRPTGFDRLTCSSNSSCSHPFPSGQHVTLNAVAGNHQIFLNWSGACSGAGTTCLVRMDEADPKTVTAHFATAMQFDMVAFQGRPLPAATGTPGREVTGGQVDFLSIGAAGVIYRTASNGQPLPSLNTGGTYTMGTPVQNAVMFGSVMIAPAGSRPIQMGGGFPQWYLYPGGGTLAVTDLHVFGNGGFIGPTLFSRCGTPDTPTCQSRVR